MNEYDIKRIKRLRDAAVQPFISFDDMYLEFYRKYSADTADEHLRYANALAYAFGKIKPSISKGELIVGKPAVRLSATERKEWDDIRENYAQKVCVFVGQDSHMAVDYEKLLRLGINGITEEIGEYMKTCPEAKKAFYEACMISLRGVVTLAEKYAACAKEQAEKETDEERQKELLKIAEICARVPAAPAEGFYEAIQSVSFVTYCLSYSPLRYFSCQQFQLGHPDRYLLPFYEKDISAGKITPDFAQTLIDCLAIQINNRVPNGLSSGYMVGGRGRNGKIVENELTLMFMQAIDDVRLVYPAVGLCYTKGMDDIYPQKACTILSHGCSHPAIFNDDIISAGLCEYGLSEEESHEYTHSTCVEITPVASSNVWVASPYMNTPQVLLDVMDKEYADFDELMNAYYSEIDKRIKENFISENEKRKIREKHTCNPLLSCFVNDCLAEGRDIEKGGARYNWIMPSFVGIANLVDSLYALKTLVFDNRQLTVVELKAMLDSNFENNESMRLHILNDIPKYGNDNDDIDSYFPVIVNHIVDECKKYKPVMKNSALIPSAFCWIMHEVLGSETGATPDGRKAGFPLGDGSGPCQGREKEGPTASVLSSTKWSHKELIGGVAVNMKFSKKLFNGNSEKKLMSIIKTYIERGGFEIQINVLDAETLKKAQQDPEQYADLLVRIGGYSDYFVRLSPNMQSELLLRTEHEL